MRMGPSPLAPSGTGLDLGLDTDYWPWLTGALLIIPVDLLSRLAGIADSEGEDGVITKGGGVLNMIWPSGGGQLFFIPTWILSGALSVLLCVDWLV